MKTVSPILRLCPEADRKKMAQQVQKVLLEQYLEQANAVLRQAAKEQRREDRP